MLVSLIRVLGHAQACREELRTTCRVSGARVNDDGSTEAATMATRAMACFPASLGRQPDHKQTGRCSCRRCKIQRDMERKDYMLDMAAGRVLTAVGGGNGDGSGGREEFHVRDRFLEKRRPTPPPPPRRPSPAPATL